MRSLVSSSFYSSGSSSLTLPLPKRPKEPLQELATPKRRLLEERLTGSNKKRSQATTLPSFLSPTKPSSMDLPFTNNSSAIVDNHLDIENEALFLDDLDINAAINYAYGGDV